jgi:hypothetical protein
MQRGIDSLLSDTEAEVMGAGEDEGTDAAVEEEEEEEEAPNTTVSSSDKSGAVFDENGKGVRKTKSYLSKKEVGDEAGNPELEAAAFREHMQEIRLQFLAKLPATIRRG